MVVVPFVIEALMPLVVVANKFVNVALVKVALVIIRFEVVEIDVIRPLESTVIIGIWVVVVVPYVPLATPVFARVSAPLLTIDASPDMETDEASPPPFPTKILFVARFAVRAVIHDKTPDPLVESTVFDACVAGKL